MAPSARASSVRSLWRSDELLRTCPGRVSASSSGMHQQRSVVWVVDSLAACNVKHLAARRAGIAKLDDANDAGGRASDKCTLILTEGDSAKALAISGLSVVGRDRYGVFPLRGKLLNVRDASATQVPSTCLAARAFSLECTLDPSRAALDLSQALRGWQMGTAHGGPVIRSALLLAVGCSAKRCNEANADQRKPSARRSTTTWRSRR